MERNFWRPYNRNESRLAFIKGPASEERQRVREIQAREAQNLRCDSKEGSQTTKD